MQTSLTVHCRTCNHQWEVVCPLPLPIPRFSQIAKGAVAAGCPACREHEPNTVLVGPAPVTREAGHADAR
jgi:hypothetical protein